MNCGNKNWNSLDELINDINKNNMYVVTSDKKIARFGKLNKYTCYKIGYPCNNVLSEDFTDSSRCWVKFCNNLNLFEKSDYFSPYSYGDVGPVCGECMCKYLYCLPCTVCITVISITSIPVCLCCNYSYACCCVCVNCDKNCDLRKSAIEKTYPFDFRKNMVYGDSKPSYFILHDTLSFTTEFNTKFGHVVLGYDKIYKQGESVVAYVTSLKVNGFNCKIDAPPVYGSAVPDGITRQTMN